MTQVDNTTIKDMRIRSIMINDLYKTLMKVGERYRRMGLPDTDIADIFEEIAMHEYRDAADDV